MSTLVKFLTPEQYLEIERKAKFKSEYYNGEMFAMSRAREPHVLIVGNAVFKLRLQLRSGLCRQYFNDMRVRVSAMGLYTYPDIAVVCGERQFLDDRRDTLLNPTLIIEVLSESTEAYDRGKKFEHYRSLPSLRDYLLVASDHISVELFTRQADGHWVLSEAHKAEDIIGLDSIGAQLRMADLYEDVELTAPAAPSE
jgi:Uma2 family endonuclease